MIMREIGIALLGYGNVGRGTYEILSSHAKDIERRLGARVVVKHILVRDEKRHAQGGAPKPLFTTNFEKILNDDEVSIVVELMGGITPAKEYLLRSMEKGRHVVTANKALLSSHGEQLFGSAQAKNVDLLFEAAVCGGIPIIRTLREALASDRVTSIHGIVNGTTNFILTAMSEEGATYEAALLRAQELGFAEADPTFDVGGMDAAQKLCLLTSLAFMSRVSPEQVSVEGIEGLLPVDLATGQEFGYVLKLLGIARRLPNGSIDARVHPAFVPQKSPLAEVRGAFNAVLLQSAALGPSLFYGQGAGAAPTGSAVVSDVIDLCRNLLAGVSGRLPMLCAPNLQDVQIQPVSQREGRYYLRFTVSDQPGVLGKIASVLGEKGVSIEAVIQKPPREGQVDASIVVFTHVAKEKSVSDALRDVDQMPATKAPTRMIRIEDQPPVAPAATGS
jgi:homoserine dehydrogenase